MDFREMVAYLEGRVAELPTSHRHGGRPETQAREWEVAGQ